MGEPRLLICLFDDPLLHVDLKFVTRKALAERVETPVVAFDRDGTIAAALAAGQARWPEQAPAWFEERFWIWVHYVATKIGRGELFEAHDGLAFLRAQVLGPAIARRKGKRQRGVRHIESECLECVAELTETVAKYDRSDCWRALEASVRIYCRNRDWEPNAEAERGVRDYIATMKS